LPAALGPSRICALEPQTVINREASAFKSKPAAIEALFGFQLIAVFNERFQQLAQAEQVMHYLALLLVALAIAIIMTRPRITDWWNRRR
jgi:hypothetical protein